MALLQQDLPHRAPPQTSNHNVVQDDFFGVYTNLILFQIVFQFGMDTL